jgi:hypothetical protein
MDYNAYKRLFWGTFIIIAALTAMVIMSFGMIFIIIPLLELICSNPYTKTLAVFAVIAATMLILKLIERNK